jgi:adenosylmethionine-8-amino-7-oxononanoate aminotransferase
MSDSPGIEAESHRSADTLASSRPGRDDLLRWDREIVWHAFTQMAEYEPFLIERAEGCTLYDMDGRAYLDGVSSLWCNLHGHRHPTLDAALRRQLDQVAHTTLLGASNPTTVQLAQRLVAMAPRGLEHVFFSSDGASAVEVAIKMAFQYWRQRRDPRPRKTRYISLSDAYHGDTIGAVSVGGVERFHKMFEPLLFPAIRVPAPNLYRPPAGLAPDDVLDDAVAKLENVLKQHEEEVAALVVEPLVQCAAGIVVHPPGYMRAVRELTLRHGVLLIADEVAVGFGRTGTMFACQQEDVSPDFLCLGKGLTAGYLPMAATLTSHEIWEAFLGEYHESKTFHHGHTYGGNPLAAAVALASLQVFEDEQTLANLPPKIARLREHLDRIAQLPAVGDARNRGLIAGIELVKDKRTGAPYPWEEKRGIAVCQFARSRGVLLRPLGNVIVVMPPLAIRIAQIDRIMEVVEEGIRNTCG